MKCFNCGCYESNLKCLNCYKKLHDKFVPFQIFCVLKDEQSQLNVFLADFVSQNIALLKNINTIELISSK